MTFFIFASFGDVVTFFRGQETKWMISIRDTLFAAIVFPCGVVSVYDQIFFLQDPSVLESI